MIPTASPPRISGEFRDQDKATQNAKEAAATTLAHGCPRQTQWPQEAQLSGWHPSQNPVELVPVSICPRFTSDLNSPRKKMHTQAEQSQSPNGAPTPSQEPWAT